MKDGPPGGMAHSQPSFSFANEGGYIFIGEGEGRTAPAARTEWRWNGNAINDVAVCCRFHEYGRQRTKMVVTMGGRRAEQSEFSGA